MYWINTPVSFHCSCSGIGFISGRIRGLFTKYGPPGIVLPRWPQRIFTTSPEWSYPGWSPGPFHQLVTTACDGTHQRTCPVADRSTPYDVTPGGATTPRCLEVPRRGATCYNSAPEGRIKQDPRLFSKRLLFQEKNPVTTEIIQYKIHQ